MDFLLNNYCDLTDSVCKPLPSSQRVKFSCFSVSEKYIILGATSGSLYAFSRDPCQFLQLIPGTQKLAINHINISPKSNCIAYSNVKGEIFLLQNCSNLQYSNEGISSLDNISSRKTNSQLVGQTENNAKVTCFCWSDDEKSFYFGDNLGSVTMISVAQYFIRSILHTSVYPILSLDTEIVQIDSFDVLLLVSTKTKTILCNTEKQTFKMIGNRPRSGKFGACFLNKSIDEYLRGQIYCARPGSRIWEVDFGGSVKQTIQYKDILATPPVDLDRVVPSTEDRPKKYLPQSLQFGKLIAMEDCSKFLLTFSDSGLYIFDPMNSNLVLWTPVKDIIDVASVKNSIYLTIKGENSKILVKKVELQHKREAFAGILNSNLSLLHDFCVSNRAFLKSIPIKLDPRLKNKMEAFKEFLIKNRQYECLELVSEVQYQEIEENGNVEVLSNIKKEGIVDRNLKGVLSTVFKNKLGSFGIFSQSKTANVELIRANSESDKLTEQKMEPFREISAFNDTDVVVEKKKFFTNKKLKRISDMLKSGEEETDSEKEEKVIKNLFLIFKSAKIGNVKLLDRYGPILDKYSIRDVLVLLKKLEKIMEDNEMSNSEARKNSSRLLFDYLKPEVVFEADNDTVEEVVERFVLLNESLEQTQFCGKCQFPLETQESCEYSEFGSVLLENFLIQQDSDSCHKLIKAAPSLLKVFIKHWQSDGYEGRERYLQLVFILGTVHMNHFNLTDWSFLFELMNELHAEGKIRCFFCNQWNQLLLPETNQRVYSWNEFLNQAARFLKGGVLLKEMLKYSRTIKNGDISKEFYLKCLQTA